MGNQRAAIGLIIVAVGIVLLLGKLGFFGFMLSWLWPLLLLIPGLLFHWAYFSRMAPAAVLIPGGIMTTYSILFLICNTFGWGLMAYLWPVFPLGVAIGLYECYLFSQDKQGGIFIASMILGGISLILFFMTIMFTVGIYILAGLFILIGLYMLLSKSRTPWR
jgi:hypothetical protein